MKVVVKDVMQLAMYVMEQFDVTGEPHIDVYLQDSITDFVTYMVLWERVQFIKQAKQPTNIHTYTYLLHASSRNFTGVKIVRLYQASLLSTSHINNSLQNCNKMVVTNKYVVYWNFLHIALGLRAVAILNLGL